MIVPSWTTAVVCDYHRRKDSFSLEDNLHVGKCFHYIVNYVEIIGIYESCSSSAKKEKRGGGRDGRCRQQFRKDVVGFTVKPPASKRCWGHQCYSAEKATQHMLPHTTGVCVCVCFVFGRRFKSINIFFPIQGDFFSVSQQVSSCMDVRMCVYVAVRVCESKHKISTPSQSVIPQHETLCCNVPVNKRIDSRHITPFYTVIKWNSHCSVLRDTLLVWTRTRLLLSLAWHQ